MMEQLVTAEQERRNVLAYLGGCFVDAQLVHGQRLFGTTLAVEATVDGGVLADLVHASWIAFVHDEHLFEFL